MTALLIVRLFSENCHALSLWQSSSLRSGRLPRKAAELNGMKPTEPRCAPRVHGRKPPGPAKGFVRIPGEVGYYFKFQVVTNHCSGVVLNGGEKWHRGRRRKQYNDMPQTQFLPNTRVATRRARSALTLPIERVQKGGRFTSRLFGSFNWFSVIWFAQSCQELPCALTSLWSLWVEKSLSKCTCSRCPGHRHGTTQPFLTSTAARFAAYGGSGEKQKSREAGVGESEKQEKH